MSYEKRQQQRSKKQPREQDPRALRAARHQRREQLGRVREQELMGAW